MNTLRAEHLKKRYKQRQILKDVSLSINSAEVVGLLGLMEQVRPLAFI